VDDDDSLPSYDRQLLDLSQASDQDRVALIAYMNDSNTSSQVIIDKTLPSFFHVPFPKMLTRVIHTFTQKTHAHTHTHTHT
jgi:3-hydroxy-3-methylglutaryl CoA synthase